MVDSFYLTYQNLTQFITLSSLILSSHEDDFQATDVLIFLLPYYSLPLNLLS